MEEDKIKKAVYQSILDFSNELRKDIKIYFSERENWIEGKPYQFDEIVTLNEFSNLLYLFINDKISKDDFKLEIQKKIGWAHTPIMLKEYGRSIKCNDPCKNVACKKHYERN